MLARGKHDFPAASMKKDTATPEAGDFFADDVEQTSNMPDKIT